MALVDIGHDSAEQWQRETIWDFCQPQGTKLSASLFRAAKADICSITLQSMTPPSPSHMMKQSAAMQPAGRAVRPCHETKALSYNKALGLAFAESQEYSGVQIRKGPARCMCHVQRCITSAERLPPMDLHHVMSLYEAAGSAAFWNLPCDLCATKPTSYAAPVVVGGY